MKKNVRCYIVVTKETRDRMTFEASLDPSMTPARLAGAIVDAELERRELARTITEANATMQSLRRKVDAAKDVEATALRNKLIRWER